MKRAFAVILLFVVVPFVTAAIVQSGAENPAIKSELESLLHVPAADYRQEWILLGSFSVRADDAEKGAKELHVVYAEPKSVEVYRENGAFPDGAVLVKDVFAAKTEALTTGIASYADTLKGRFVMVKDKTDSYADKLPLWGDGWGWAFYEGTETRKTITTDYRKDCLGCHEPVRSQDLIYVQGYPVLKN